VVLDGGGGGGEHRGGDAGVAVGVRTADHAPFHDSDEGDHATTDDGTVHGATYRVSAWLGRSARNLSCPAVLLTGSSPISQPYSVGDAWRTLEAAYNARVEEYVPPVVRIHCALYAGHHAPLHGRGRRRPPTGQSCCPAVGRWRLRPGDCIVFRVKI
jgi:hypothetical protein